ncbi:MAG: DUF2071 domain-containing protein [Mariniblastus sp.]|nr:DUF2071 domain-containing protein [Mariniblastus sp.]
MNLRPTHPVPMETLFRRCILANFEMKPEVLAARLPDYLEPDIHQGRSFVSVVIADMERMRPAFLPKIMGVTYNQIVYRAVVRCGDRRGVTFLRSDSDSRFMAAAGNLLTFFRFHRAKISWEKNQETLDFVLKPLFDKGSGIRLSLELDSLSSQMPADSGFSDLAEAQDFLTELYSAFGGRRRDGRIETVNIRRSAWQGKVVKDRIHQFEAMDGGSLFGSGETRLNSVFLVENLYYHWYRLSLSRPERVDQ